MSYFIDILLAKGFGFYPQGMGGYYSQGVGASNYAYQLYQKGNQTFSLSSVPANVTHEMDYLEQHGMKELSGECLCCGAHGLSLLITAKHGNNKQTVLFDAGPEGQVLKQNLARLHINPSNIDDLVLSHEHWDHAGGFIQLLELLQKANSKHHTAFHVNPDMFYQRATQHDGHIHPFKKIPSLQELENLGDVLPRNLEINISI